MPCPHEPTIWTANLALLYQERVVLVYGLPIWPWFARLSKKVRQDGFPLMSLIAQDVFHQRPLLSWWERTGRSRVPSFRAAIWLEGRDWGMCVHVTVPQPRQRLTGAESPCRGCAVGMKPRLPSPAIPPLRPACYLFSFSFSLLFFASSSQSGMWDN